MSVLLDYFDKLWSDGVEGDSELMMRDGIMLDWMMRYDLSGAEVLQLQAKDASSSSVRISATRTLIFDCKSSARLRQYLALRSTCKWSGEEPLFHSRKGTTALSRSGVHRRWVVAVKAAGLPPYSAREAQQIYRRTF